MRLEDQVCTLEQSIKLMKFGIIGDSVWCWVFPKNKHMISSNKGLHHISLAKEIVHDNEGDEFDHEMVSAFSVAELGIMLPDVDNHEFVWASFPDAGITEEGLDIDPPAFSVFIGPSVCHLEEEPFDNKVYPTEAQARAAFLIYCIENNKTTVAEVNHRLSPSSDK